MLQGIAATLLGDLQDGDLDDDEHEDDERAGAGVVVGDTIDVGMMAPPPPAAAPALPAPRRPHSPVRPRSRPWRSSSRPFDGGAQAASRQAPPRAGRGCSGEPTVPVPAALLSTSYCSFAC